MDKHTLSEICYKNGYEKGYEDGKRDAVKHGKWVVQRSGLFESWVNCPECGTIGSRRWKCCPVCETRMDEE